MTPRKVASRKKAVRTSYPSNGPATLPAFSMNPGQFVPNWKLIVRPETTPSPKESAKTFTQSR